MESKARAGPGRPVTETIRKREDENGRGQNHHCLDFGPCSILTEISRFYSPSSWPPLHLGAKLIATDTNACPVWPPHI